ncbi:PRD domain-containing protein [Clostridium sartagoforme]|uniref:PRD domain-containing protein n=1 Tax=Clostridium sartagoforme TaxID=84031 RepID=A0A4S2DAW6_9CLOT|nr:PTS sugar transporter subunit IIA [Clostridium sartagoforme]TGY38969.1 PRD domain-containing protein [Clostridium sartagoforme]
MNHKLLKLIEYLYQQSSPISCKELAQHFKVTTRTIQNYVKDINHISDNNAIISSKSGYMLNKQKTDIIFEKLNVNIPDDNISRCTYILKKLLTQTTGSINIFDLSDELFVSYSTFRNVLSYTNNYLKKYNLKVISNNNLLHLQGNERDLRRLMSTIIYDEVSVNSFSLENLYEYFNFELVTKVISFLDSFSKNNGFTINHFTKMNLILHFCILIKRIQDGNIEMDSAVNCDNNKLLLECDYKLITILHKEIFNTFNIDIDNDNLKEAYLLLQINSDLSLNLVNDVLGKEIISLMKEIIKEIKVNYLLDLNTPEFITPFSLHLKKLIFRIQHGKVEKNPILKHIKKTLPMIYDISTYVSLYINNFFGNEVIAEDEIGFIALHIGAEIHRQKSDSEKISTILVLPKYLELESYVKNQILKSFHENLNIVDSIYSYEYLHNFSHTAELIITTFPLSYFKNTNIFEIVSISPFFNSEDQLKIHEGIDSIKKKRLNQILINQFDYFFNKELFHLDNGSYKDEYDVINFLAKDLINKNYAPKEFLTHIINREKLTSTAFNNVSVPHQFFIETMKTGTNILISKEGIRWKNNLVHIVLMVCIKNEDKKNFTFLYEALLNLFTQDDIVKIVKTSTSFEDFKKKVLLFIE